MSSEHRPSPTDRLRDYLRGRVVKIVAQDQNIKRGYLYAFLNPEKFACYHLGNHEFRVIAEMSGCTPDQVKRSYVARGGKCQTRRSRINGIAS